MAGNGHNDISNDIKAPDKRLLLGQGHNDISNDIKVKVPVPSRVAKGHDDISNNIKKGPDIALAIPIDEASAMALPAPRPSMPLSTGMGHQIMNDPPPPYEPQFKSMPSLIQAPAQVASSHHVFTKKTLAKLTDQHYFEHQYAKGIKTGKNLCVSYEATGTQYYHNWCHSWDVWWHGWSQGYAPVVSIVLTASPVDPKPLPVH
ncbi:hypothetical protein DACRYDRAFT_16233 [Dacryopinax primogenitus]|uniref:Uncharacterized protein n=1 Tax=Dacryopinax primogenitus (strain DJM 731) TaxID=1858805 RepID=M5G0C0_DACPD|nr:uncharacterized protein DACRYDRAFT_16233 [Dacryopinax primogenitus]EJU01590.1 hypothetical protein DACRYDRAFT_16233 [Dacryopinax primogenitus]